MLNHPKPKQWGSDCGRYIRNEVTTRNNFIRNPIVEGFRKKASKTFVHRRGKQGGQNFGVQ